jgi:hypothetical protein
MEPNLATPGIPQMPRQRAPHRSRVSSGSKLLPLVDARSVTARRYRDLFQAVCDDLGGIDHLSTAQLQLARRASMLSAEAERQEAMACRADAEFSVADYGLNVSLLCRVFGLLGVQRIPRDVDSGPLNRHFAKPHKS